jgi:hypothetical protein
MARVLRSIWASLIWLFVILIPIQFYLAGHGAMEGGHSTDQASKTPPVLTVMPNAWDPHMAVGTIMSLIALLILIVGIAAQLPRRLLGFTAVFFVFMLIQFILPFFNDSASTRPIAALHVLNALIVTGIAIGLGIRARPYLPIARFRVESREPIGTEMPAR